MADLYQHWKVRNSSSSSRVRCGSSRPVPCRSRGLATALLISGLLPIAGCRDDAAFPDRPLLIVCPWAVGGGTNAVSREVAMLLEEELGQPVNVLNATGGAGVTGHSRGARARPDGYTIMMMTVELNMLHWRGLTDITHRDFEPLALLNRDAAALFVRADAPWKDLKDLTAAIHASRAESGEKLTASGTAKGGIWHLAVSGWLRAAGLEGRDVTWVPNNGAGPSIQALVAGGLDMVCSSLPEADVQLRAGKLRCLGVMAPARLEPYPEVPTFVEQDVDWTLAGWRGLGLPRGVPQARAAALESALGRIIQGPKFTRFMQDAGFDASYEPAGTFATTLTDTDKKLGELLTTDFKNLAPDRFGPMFFPSLLGGALVLILLVLGLQNLRRRGTGLDTTDDIPTEAPEYEPFHDRSRLGLRVFEVLALLALFGVFVETVGFVISGVVLLLVLLLRFGARPWVALPLSALVVGVGYHLLANYLRLPLPRGWFGW